MSQPSAITLDNLGEKLPLWRPNDKEHLYAVVDMGSNGIRFSITSLAPPKTRLLIPVYATRAAISLFDALNPSSSGPVFPEETIKAVASTLARFRQTAILYAVPPSNIIVLATEAMRRAGNAGDMLEAIAAATEGLQVHVLDPAVETLFGAVMGSRCGLVDVKGGALFLDLGGGSVQMTWVDTDDERYEMEAAAAGESLPYGAAKLTRILDEEPAHVQEAELDKLGEGMLNIYADLCRRFPVLRAIRDAYERGGDDDDNDGPSHVDLYLCGGGFRGYGSMLMHNDVISPYPISSTATYSVPGRVFGKTARMRRVNDEYGGKIFGMSKRRRRQFPAIAAVVDALVGAVPNIGRVTFCGGSNRQGVLMMKLPRPVRESNPLDVLAAVGPDERPAVDAALQLLRAAEPPATAPATVLGLGLGPLLVRDMWGRRAGHDADTNSVFALHHALVRDADCPGLTHLARALLGLSACARWGRSLGPAEEALFEGLRDVADGHGDDVSFWALYAGAVAGLVASVFPVMPEDDGLLQKTIRLKTEIIPSGDRGKRDKVVLRVGLAADHAAGIDTDALADKFESAMGRKGHKRGPKVSAEVTSFS